MRTAIPRVLVLTLICTAAATISHDGRALELRQARDSCRISSGIPTYRACRFSGGSHEDCMPKARSAVSRCIKSAWMAAHPKAPLLSTQEPTPLRTAEEVVALKRLPVKMIAPPRNVSDVTSILDQQRPSQDTITRLISEADASPTSVLGAQELANFYYSRAQARTTLGRIREAQDDTEKAITIGKNSDYVNVLSRYEQFLAVSLFETGDLSRLAAILNKQRSMFSTNNRGRLFLLNLMEIKFAIRAGDIGRAEGLARQNRELLNEARRWPVFLMYAAIFQAHVEDGDARIADARGKYADAEAHYKNAATFYRRSLVDRPKWKSASPQSQIELAADWALALEGRAKVNEGRISEGETDVRQALLSQLSSSGKYNSNVAGILAMLAYVIEQQGRFADAEQLILRVLEIYGDLSYPRNSVQSVSAHLFLARLMNEQGRYQESANIFDHLDSWTAKWEPSRREMFSGGPVRVIALLHQGDHSHALEIAQGAFDRELHRSGENSLNTAFCRGYLAVALAFAGKTQEALQAFQQSLPALVSKTGGYDEDSGSTAVARERTVKFIIEGYLRLLSQNPSIAPPDAAEHTFRYSDVLRGQSVQRALRAASVRSATSNSALVKLIRTSQDSEKEIGAATATINNLLSLANSERDEGALKTTRDLVSSLQNTRSETLKQIFRQFPRYGDLVGPSLPDVKELRSALTEREALLSFYFGRFDSFVWVLRKDTPIRFLHIPMTISDLNDKVKRLREALEPDVSLISDIPAFDVSAAYSLYEDLLKPIENSWKPASSLIVVTNGALGRLPLSLLPTSAASVDAASGLLFEGYRSVPWLARTHTVTQLPSISSLQALRSLPLGETSRQKFVGFGDPYFSKEQAEEAGIAEQRDGIPVASIDMRGVRLNRRASPQSGEAASVQLEQLPRLPDTAEELRSIAVALNADPTKVLNLGRDANEQRVKTMNLAGFKIVAFATHSLASGDLDGLTQPALALSAPEVAGTDGDGLLSMEEILALKLDADWVVLSACNTGAGTSAGAEAASGLGRAFFYAGARALLVTNWSVHSQSSRELVTDLFRRQATQPHLTRSEALRQAMLALADGPGYVGAEGRPVFTYAHPLFWAPYSILGDGDIP